MPLKKKIFLVTALLYILYTIFPLFADRINIPVWLPSIAVVVVMVSLYPKALANKTFYWFLVYAVVLGIYVLIGKHLTIGIGNIVDRKKILIEFAYILPTVCIFCITYYLKDDILNKRIINWSILILYVSFVVAIPLMLRYSSLRAALAEKGDSFHVTGLPGYSLMHAYVLFLPVVAYGIKMLDGRKKIWSLLGLLVLCFVIYDTFVTTSLVVMIAILMFAVFYSEKHKTLFLLFSILLLFLVIILYKEGFFISFIDWIMPAFDGTAVEPKLLDFKASMLEGELTGGSITDRQNLHAISWNSFFQNPIFGTSIVGNHSALVDRFGGMGIVAGLPFLLIITSFIQQMKKLYSTKLAKVYYGLGIIAGFVFLYQKGIWGCESWLMYMVLMPIGLLVIERTTIVK